MRRAILLAFVGIALMTGAGADAAGAISPSFLAHELLTRQYPKSQLPRGFNAARISSRQQAAGRVIDVGVHVKSVAGDGQIEYFVCQDPSDALDWFVSVQNASPGEWRFVPARLLGSSLPGGGMILQVPHTQPVLGTKYTTFWWTTYVVVRYGTVVINVQTVRGIDVKTVRDSLKLSEKSRDKQATLMLAASALKHLRNIESQKSA